MPRQVWRNCWVNLCRLLRRFPGIFLFVVPLLVWPTHQPATMNYLRRRLSDSSFVANLPNGYMMDLQRPTSPGSSTSSPASPATERRPPPSLPSQTQVAGSVAGSGLGSGSTSSPGSFLSSFSSVVKSAQMAQNVAAAAHAKSAASMAADTAPGCAQLSKPAVRTPKILLVIDDQHTDWWVTAFSCLCLRNWDLGKFLKRVKSVQFI